MDFKKLISRTKNYIQDKAKYIKLLLGTNKEKIIVYAKKVYKKIAIFIAKSIARIWIYYYKLKFYLSAYLQKYFILGIALLYIVLLVCSWIILSLNNQLIEEFFSSEYRFETLRSVLLSIGGSLIAATAISFSLILFAMQVNVERMPHGLFKKLSSDKLLLNCFVTTFLLAIFVSCAAIFYKKGFTSIVLFSSAWSTILVLTLFIIAYRRALEIVSPTKQLSIIIKSSEINLRNWAKAASRCSPIFKEDNDQESSSLTNSTHDMNRVAYLRANVGWYEKALQGIEYCIVFSRRYSELGDHETSRVALNSIISITSAYIHAKGKTFYIDPPFFSNPLSHDEFISQTLEHLRRNIQIGLSRKDEQLLEQIINTLENLNYIYLTIDYSTVDNAKTHAVLASHYLTSAIEQIASTNMTDVIMEGFRSLGRVAQRMVFLSDPLNVTTISEKISIISGVCSVKERNSPATKTGIDQLAKILIALIKSNARDIAHQADKVGSDVKFVAEILLQQKDSPMSSFHSSCLASFYSGTSHDTLLSWLTDLTNAVIDAEENNEDAQRAISHIEQWAENLHRNQKELFLNAIEKKSHLTFDLINWIKHITKLLLALSEAKCATLEQADELRKHALWLAYILNWVPDTEEIATFIENYSFTESLYEMAIDANRYSDDYTKLEIRKLLLLWCFSVSKYTSGWASFENALYGLISINLIFELEDSILINELQEFLNKDEAPSLEIRMRASSNITEKSSSTFSQYSIRSIEASFNYLNEASLRALMRRVANILIEPNSDSEQDSSE